MPICLFFFQDLEGLTGALGRVSSGISGPELPLWAGGGVFGTSRQATQESKFRNFWGDGTEVWNQWDQSHDEVH